ncbi:hypothetical protein CU048_14505 [Beijerinckiaceae bacterium]|nr:hypothetical protein CU048_14505 [Beijerinckiaceae bacterium]
MQGFVLYSQANAWVLILKNLIVTIGLCLAAVFLAGWFINDACSSYRGVFRPADLVCDMPFGRQLEISVARPSPFRAPAEPAGNNRSICRSFSKGTWQFACDLPSGRELDVSLSPNRARIKCKLFVDCPAQY